MHKIEYKILKMTWQLKWNVLIGDIYENTWVHPDQNLTRVIL